jgi:hypothetical protein
MKKILIIALAIFSTTLVNAQLTGGGNTSSTSNQPKAKAQNNDLIKDKKYLTFDIAIPYLGSFGTYYTAGLGLDFGVNKYLGFKLPEVMKIGIDYGFSVHTNTEYIPFSNYNNRLIFLSTRVGVVYTFNIVDDLTVDAKLTLQPTLMPSISSLDYNDIYFSIRRGLGFYANYKMWRAGFQLSGGNLIDSDLYSTGMNSGRFDISLGFKF